MKQVIYNQLKEFAERNEITILFAVENGARNWGLDSKSSDHDVRFVYYRKARDYLGLFPLKDSFEWKAMGATDYQATIDYQGFDIFKFARLLLSSNPNMIEWLRSRIYYKEPVTAYENNLWELCKSIGKDHYNPTALFYHYRSMGKNNYFKYIHADKPYHTTAKRYLYAFRGLFNALYLLSMERVPTLDFHVDMWSQDFLPMFVFDFISYYCVPEKRQDNGNVPIERRREIDEWLYTMFELTNIAHLEKREIPMKMKVQLSEAIQKVIR